MTGAIEFTRDRVRFAVRVTPRGGRDAIEGWQSNGAGKAHLKLRVRVAAEDGKANEAVVRLVADELSVPRGQIEIVSGASARLKMLEIRGNGDALQRRLAAFGDAT